MFGSCTAALIISNKEINDIMKIVQSLEESSLFIKDISETIKNEALGASLLGNLLKSKDTIRAGESTISNLTSLFNKS